MELVGHRQNEVVPRPRGGEEMQMWNCVQQTIKHQVQGNETASRDPRTDFMASECQAGAGRHFLGCWSLAHSDV